jgi:hypothetical protein
MGLINKLKSSGERAAECFQFELVDTYKKVANSAILSESFQIGCALSLEVPHQRPGSLLELTNMIRKFGAEERMNDYKVDSVITPVIRYGKISIIPQIFLLQNKRFYFDKRTNTFKKIDQKINVPLEFDWPQETMTNPRLVRCEVIGGLVHRGPSGDGGHYVAYVKTPDGFLECNDRAVQFMSENDWREKLQDAYVVAYRCRDVGGRPGPLPQGSASPVPLRLSADQLTWLNAFENGNFPVPTGIFPAPAGIAGDQSQNLIGNIFRIAEQKISDNLSAAESELNNFPRRNEFNGRELNWIKFLIGGNIPSQFVERNSESSPKFRYANCRDFRRENNENLENYHNYVQVVFPNLSRSGSANFDLHLSRAPGVWRALCTSCPNVRRNMRLNMQLNAIYMLQFWGFRFDFGRNGIVLVDNPGSVLHAAWDHNQSRATRFIEALQQFGCKDLLTMFKTLLESNYQNNSSYHSHWRTALNNPFTPLTGN